MIARTPRRSEGGLLDGVALTASVGGHRQAAAPNGTRRGSLLA